MVVVVVVIVLVVVEPELINTNTRSNTTLTLIEVRLRSMYICTLVPMYLYPLKLTTPTNYLTSLAMP